MQESSLFPYRFLPRVQNVVHGARCVLTASKTKPNPTQCQIKPIQTADDSSAEKEMVQLKETPLPTCHFLLRYTVTHPSPKSLRDEDMRLCSVKTRRRFKAPPDLRASAPLPHRCGSQRARRRLRRYNPRISGSKRGRARATTRKSTRPHARTRSHFPYFQPEPRLSVRDVISAHVTRTSWSRGPATDGAPLIKSRIPKDEKAAPLYIYICIYSPQNIAEGIHSKLT